MVNDLLLTDDSSQFSRLAQHLPRRAQLVAILDEPRAASDQLVHMVQHRPGRIWRRDKAARIHNAVQPRKDKRGLAIAHGAILNVAHPASATGQKHAKRALE